MTSFLFVMWQNVDVDALSAMKTVGQHFYSTGRICEYRLLSQWPDQKSCSDGQITVIYATV